MFLRYYACISLDVYRRFGRVQLADLRDRPIGTNVDVLAFVVEAKEPQTVISRVSFDQTGPAVRASHQEHSCSERTSPWIVPSDGKFHNFDDFALRTVKQRSGMGN